MVRNKKQQIELHKSKNTSGLGRAVDRELLKFVDCMDAAISPDGEAAQRLRQQEEEHKKWVSLADRRNRAFEYRVAKNGLYTGTAKLPDEKKLKDDEVKRKYRAIVKGA